MGKSLGRKQEERLTPNVPAHLPNTIIATLPSQISCHSQPRSPHLPAAHSYHSDSNPSPQSTDYNPYISMYQSLSLHLADGSEGPTGSDRRRVLIGISCRTARLGRRPTRGGAARRLRQWLYRLLWQGKGEQRLTMRTRLRLAWRRPRSFPYSNLRSDLLSPSKQTWGLKMRTQQSPLPSQQSNLSYSRHPTVPAALSPPISPPSDSRNPHPRQTTTNSTPTSLYRRCISHRGLGCRRSVLCILHLSRRSRCRRRLGNRYLCLGY